MNSRRHAAAFSLVEVAMALGIIAFSVVAIMGLLATAVNSSKAASDDTLIANMADALINDMRHLYFMNARQGQTGGNYNNRISNSYGVLAGTDDVPPDTQPVPVTAFVYFDAGGSRLQNTSVTPPVDLAGTDVLNRAVYQCQITALADAASLSATSTDAVPTSAQAVNLLRVTLVFSSPVGVAKPPIIKTIHATLARY